jgi:hypothetical protein
MSPSRIALLGNILVLISFVLISMRAPVLGLAFGFLGNVIFFIYGIKTGHCSFCVTAALLGSISLYGIYNWLI